MLLNWTQLNVQTKLLKGITAPGPQVKVLEHELHNLSIKMFHNWIELDVQTKLLLGSCLGAAATTRGTLSTAHSSASTTRRTPCPATWLDHLPRNTSSKKCTSTGCCLHLVCLLEGSRSVEFKSKVRNANQKTLSSLTKILQNWNIHEKQANGKKKKIHYYTEY